MKSIPAALRAKLLNEIKAQSTDSQPNIRVVATQTSYNTLLSEPIHEDETADYGDVTIRQIAGESEPSMAYSICIDEDDEVIIRKRNFPALYDNPWEYVWTFPNEAEEVAIEFDGTWKLDPTNQWYYLETEEYPYIFTVESGALYVQKWNDSTTRIQLCDQGVVQISACKGWHNSIDTDDDQGLIIGYMKATGAIYYRALCEQQDGTLAWELEHQVNMLQNQNDGYLQLFRTNDFRIGFLTSKSGQIKFALTDRTYAGMSVRPETVTGYADASMWIDDIKNRNAYCFETVQATVPKAFFLLDDANSDTSLKIASSARLDREETWYSYGVTITFDRSVYNGVMFGNYISVTKTLGGSTTDVPLSSVSYDFQQKTVTLLFSGDVIKTAQLNINIRESIEMWYLRVQQQKWYIPAMTHTIESVTRDHYAYANETMTGTASAEIDVDNIVEHDYSFDETLGGQISDYSVILEPVSIKPI